ncbi:LAGLIDADG endonuclease [Streptomyces phage Faust]|uniref:LAGLIDADG endonuclease n=1 Tax=Streptomyces phage Faust TaxID=2767565 RepID=A0A7G9UYK8_9CAUD|nr:HNH endonuclease [Streptomyces phage Faust]QNN99113.1 LAGLIDADG endonuclease [Streptomyces phage Faust]
MLNLYYVAGLFDGEGWFEIKRAAGSHYRASRDWAYQCHAFITMRDKQIIEALAEQFGGTATLVKKRSDKHSDYYAWRVTGKNALAFAESIEPYLIGKKDQAQLIIGFQNEKILNGNQPLPDSRYEFYTSCYAKMRELNTKGVGKI